MGAEGAEGRIAAEADALKRGNVGEAEIRGGEKWWFLKGKNKKLQKKFKDDYANHVLLNIMVKDPQKEGKWRALKIKGRVD